MGKSQLGFFDNPELKGPDQKPYGFYHEDRWEPWEIDAIDATLMQAIGLVHGGYNYWMFSKYGGGNDVRYSVKRWTWEYGDWWSYNLGELLDTLWFEHMRSAHLIPPGAELMTPDDLLKLTDDCGAVWYRDDLERFSEYYGSMGAIWYVRMPHLRVIIYTHDQSPGNTSQVWTEVKYLNPNKRVAPQSWLRDVEFATVSTPGGTYVLVTGQRTDDFLCYINGHAGVWECAQSRGESLSKMVQTLNSDPAYYRKYAVNPE